MNQQETREAIAEGIGTFALVLVGAGAVAMSPDNVLVAALAHGLILIAAIATYGHISGAHVNPAVTLGLFVGGKISMKKMGIYMLAQFIGGLVAAAFLRLVLNGFPGVATLGQAVPATNDINALDVVLVEGVMTFFLVSVIYQAATFGKGGQLTPVLVGLTYGACILFAGPLTGGSLNPARSLGPALIAEDPQRIFEVGNYLIGIFLGGAMAGFVHMDTFAPDESDEADRKKRRLKKR